MADAMDETRFHQLIEPTLQHWHDALEPAYDAATVEELELDDGVLTVTSAKGTVWVLSRHTASRQLWLASPISGGHHFIHEQDWKLKDGRSVADVWLPELAAQNIAVAA